MSRPDQVRDAIELLQDWIDSTDWDGADPHEGERANATAILLEIAAAHASTEGTRNV